MIEYGISTGKIDKYRISKLESKIKKRFENINDYHKILEKEVSLYL